MRWITMVAMGAGIAAAAVALDAGRLEAQQRRATIQVTVTVLPNPMYHVERNAGYRQALTETADVSRDMPTGVRYSVSDVATEDRLRSGSDEPQTPEPRVRRVTIEYVTT